MGGSAWTGAGSGGERDERTDPDLLLAAGPGPCLNKLLPGQFGEPEHRLRRGVGVGGGFAERVLDAGRGRPAVRIKWPNDLWLERRKLGGILIEQDAVRATVGIGINVSQRSFPESIARTATSLALHSFAVDRLDIACHLVQRIDGWVAADPERMAHEYMARDALAGTRCSLSTPEGVVDGLVLSCDPRVGMRIRTSAGDRTLPAASTSVLASLDRATS